MGCMIMKKKTINMILIAVIVLMSVSICFLIFCIATRPRYVTVTEPESVVITEAEAVAEEAAAPDAISADSGADESATEPVPDETMHGKTSTRVNIRNAASVDAKVLDTVDGGTTFDILEIQDNGWTKILYNDEEAYISSDYVIVVTETE